MKRFRDTTYGDTLAAFNRYRPFIAVVAAVVLVQVLLPARSGDRGDQAATVAAAPAVLGATAPEAVSPTPLGSDGTTSSPIAAPAAPIAGGSTAEHVEGATPGASPPPSTPGPTGAGATFPGIGTAAALGAPDCDRDTGDLMLLTKAYPLPCVPLWNPANDNGGATAPGVTRDTIRVLVMQEEKTPEGEAGRTALGGGTYEEIWQTIQNYVTFYNRHAELYGRKVVLSRELMNIANPEAVRAAVLDAVNKHKPFGGINAHGNSWQPSYEMAVRKVVSPSCCGPDLWDMYQKTAPYLWNVNAGRNGAERQAYYMRAEFLVKRLAGRPARWAGDALRTQTRKFGWLYPDGAEAAGERAVFIGELAKHGVAFTAMAGINPTDQAQATEQVRTAIVKFKAAGVNVILPDAGPNPEILASKEATNQRYFPEWYGGEGASGSTLGTRLTWDVTQVRALYGQKAVPVQPPTDKFDYAQVYNWEFGAQPAGAAITIFPMIYHLFLGIQAAGPNLTPLTFRDAIFGLPPVGGALDGAVTIPERSYGLHGVWPFESPEQPDYAGADDATYYWWCATCRGQDELGKDAVGMQMVPEGGRRFRAQRLPATEAPLFVMAGAVGSLPEVPAQERPKPYANKKGCATRWQCFGPG